MPKEVITERKEREQEQKEVEMKASQASVNSVRATQSMEESPLKRALQRKTSLVKIEKSPSQLLQEWVKPKIEKKAPYLLGLWNVSRAWTFMWLLWGDEVTKQKAGAQGLRKQLMDQNVNGKSEISV